MGGGQPDQIRGGQVTVQVGDPVTVDLRFLGESKAFTADFSDAFRRVGQVDPMIAGGGYGSGFDFGFDVGVETPYGVVRSERPKHPLWGRFAFPPTPQGLLLFRDPPRIKLVSSFVDPEFPDADDAVLGGQYYVCAYGCWQCDLLESAGFQIVPAQNLNQPPYMLDEQGEML